MKVSSTRDPQKALAASAKAADWPRAAQLAVELGDEEKMVRFSLMAAMGRVPPGFERATPLRAAQLLAEKRHHQLAALLFEHAQDYLNAGRSASAARQPAQAARHFERAGEWLEAARCYQALSRSGEALRILDYGERSLDSAGGPRAAGQIDEIRLLRAELLLQMGQ
ncbi:MAG TPA: hypothetical protein VGV61_15075, partial [Thermoanaerobaculia bacterium]|nr:hypothetical protein [Thermoanaerobaculia bacterium]